MDETTTAILATGQTATVQISDDTGATATAATELVETELLVEEISIDGMCGVY